MEIAMADPGRIFVFDHQKDVVTARLFNFGIAKHRLKPEHEDWLTRNVVGLLQGGGSMWITGLASPSDTDAFNLALSRRRADAVIGFLRNQAPNNFEIALDLALGERAARFAGVSDGTEDENWRAVILSAWQRSKPPPPPHVPQPRQVERRWYVSFLTQVSSTAPSGDPPSTERLFKISNALAQKYWLLGHLSEEKKSWEPETNQVVKISTFREEAETNLGIATTTIVGCVVRYEWGVRKGPCLLIDGQWRGGAFKHNDPFVYKLTNAQADLWVNDPYTAFNSLRGWNLDRYSYDDYLLGKELRKP
jgi:hypothetical protein